MTTSNTEATNKGEELRATIISNVAWALYDKARGDEISKKEFAKSYAEAERLVDQYGLEQRIDELTNMPMFIKKKGVRGPSPAGYVTKKDIDERIEELTALKAKETL